MQQPVIHHSFHPDLAQIDKKTIGDITLYFLNDPKCEICKLEWIFPVGTKHQNLPLQANVCTNLLTEGTQKISALDFSTRLDELGAYFNVEPGRDYTTFTLHVLSAQLPEALVIIQEIFENPLLGQKEFDTLLLELRHEFEQNSQKGGFVAQQKLMNLLFPSHPYGITSSLESFNDLSLQDIKEFAHEHFINQSFDLYFSGNASAENLRLLENFYQNKKLKQKQKRGFPLVVSSQKAEAKINKTTAQQDSLRMGQIAPNYQHQDFLALSIVNTIFGGYFGSRLMQNIREDKGWTYGISSSIIPCTDACYLVVACDVNLGKGEAAIKEIEKEMQLMQNEAISKEELAAVKAYLKGNLIRSFDGVFEQMEKFISVNLFDKTQQHYLDYMNLLDKITPSEIQEVAKKYLIPQKFSTVLVSNEA